MNSLALIAVLTSVSSWTTPCAQTQVGKYQGYTIDRASFVATEKTNEAKVELIRDWYESPTCSGEAYGKDESKGTVTFGKELGSIFESANGSVVEADFTLNGVTELGAISVSGDQKTIRLARGFGALRNTMLSIIGYKAN